MSFSRFETARRSAARRALYASLLCVAAAFGLFLDAVLRPAEVQGDIDWQDRDWESEVAVRLLQQYIRVPSGPDGDEYAAALWLSGPLQAAGIDVEIERIGGHQANLWADLRGSEPAPLVLLGHLDVEPVEDATAWEVPPYSGALTPPLIQGRGSFDMKSYTIAHLLGMLDVAAHPHPPARSVRLVATAEEETGSDLGLRWLLHRHPEILKSAWVILTEGGLVETRAMGDIKYWAIEFGQQRQVDLIACSSSQQRLEELRADVIEFSFDQSAPRLTPESRQFLTEYRESRDRPRLRDDLADLERLLRDPAALERVPPILRFTLRDEILVGHPEPDGNSWKLRISILLLSDSEREATRRSLLPEWMLAGVSVYEPSPDPVGGYSPLDHPLYLRLERALADRSSQQAAGPYLLTQARTDARHLRPIEVPTYGWSPFPIFTSFTLRAGKPHEKIDLPGYTTGVAAFRDILPALLGDNNRHPDDD